MTYFTIFILMIMVIIETKHCRSSAFYMPPPSSKKYTHPSITVTRTTTTITTTATTTAAPNQNHRSTTRLYSNTKNRNINEDDAAAAAAAVEKEAYLKAMKEAAKDPVRFQEFVAEQQRVRQRRLSEEDGTEEVGEKKKGYVPIEQWEEERSKVDAEMAWEEKVRFDGRRFGDGFQQNEILRKNL